MDTVLKWWQVKKSSVNWQLKILISWPFTQMHCELSVIRQKQILTCNAYWSVQTSINDGKREIMWNISLHFHYISSVQRNTSSTFQQAFELQFKTKLLKAKFSPLPPLAAAGSWDNILVPVYHKSVWTIIQHGALLFPATFSKPAFYLVYPITEDQLVNLGKCVNSTGATSKLWPAPLRTA